MRKNLIQPGTKHPDGSRSIKDDWFDGRIPPNVHVMPDVYLDSTYSFDMFHSQEVKAMTIGKASACYDRATFITSGSGYITIGAFAILNGTTLICSNRISIGNFVMMAWGSVVCDNHLSSNLCPKERGDILSRQTMNGSREMPFSSSMPITIEDNVWIGFDAIVLPGTHIGKGSVIGSKSVVSGTIPPYSVVAGIPGRIIRQLQASDQSLPDDPDELVRCIYLQGG